MGTLVTRKLVKIPPRTTAAVPKNNRVLVLNFYKKKNKRPNPECHR